MNKWDPAIFHSNHLKRILGVCHVRRLLQAGSDAANLVRTTAEKLMDWATRGFGQFQSLRPQPILLYPRSCEFFILVTSSTWS